MRIYPYLVSKIRASNLCWRCLGAGNVLFTRMIKVGEPQIPLPILLFFFIVHITF